ncbi:uncharacterized protein LOC142766065 [Rhipicephalus microplus]|uniref:uncharacterized protein LOC142766065 n=1 Tax=Rhipicephalus microplus TaxID=6941 RepID=UPI003F6B7754
MRQAGAKRRATSSQPRIPPSPHVGQQDTDNLVSGRKSQPTTTTNQSAAITTRPRPSQEDQRQTAIIPGYQHQWTTVDQPLLAATLPLSPHNEQRHVKVASGKESEQVTTNQFETATATPLSPCVGKRESSMLYGDKDQFTTLKQPFITLTSSLSPYDGQCDTDKMSSGKKKNKLDTANQSISALTTPLSSRESRQEQSMIPEDEGVIVIQPLTAPTSSLSSHNGQQRKTFIAAVTGGAEDERTTIQTAPVVKTTSNRTSPLSPQQEGHHEAAQTTTAVVATTAATTTTVAASSPLDHVLFCGHGGFQTLVLVCTTLAFFTAVEHALASTNLARTVDHSCKPPARYSYTDPQAWRNFSIPLVLGEDVTERRSQCERFKPSLLRADYPDNRTTVPCDSGVEYDTGDSHLHFIVDEWKLVCKRSWIVSALAAANMAVGVVGSAVAYMVPSCGMITTAYLVEELPCWLLAFSERRCAENVLSRAASSHRFEPCSTSSCAAVIAQWIEHEQLVAHQEQEGPNAIISDHASYVVADGYVLTRAGRRLSSTASILALSITTGALSAVKVLGAPVQLDAVVAISGLQVQDISAITAFAFSAELCPTVPRRCLPLAAATRAAASAPSQRHSSTRSGRHRSGRSLRRGSRHVTVVACSFVVLLMPMGLALPETRQLPPWNTAHDMMVAEDKWLFFSPIRVARNKGKRELTNTTLRPES